MASKVDLAAHTILGAVLAAAVICGGCGDDDSDAWGDSNSQQSAGDTYEDDDFPIGRSLECDDEFLEEVADDDIADCDDLFELEEREFADRDAARRTAGADNGDELDCAHTEGVEVAEPELPLLDGEGCAVGLRSR